ncbi:MAG: hypothetical protein L3J83_08650, partial [Proteobacteria bacterium]|nr:hypothetical protein [Pseudomonadota bacterium]
PFLPNSATSTQSNGLDFCLALTSASTGATENPTQINIGAIGINVAYVLADSGTIDANNDGDLFDGANGAGLKFAQPHASRLNNYDDNVLAVGFNELAGRLNCAKVLAETNGAARASYAAYDMWLLALQYKDYRDFHVHYLEIMLDIANTKFALAIAAEALAIASAALAIGVAIISGGASAIVGAVLAVVALADATAALVLATMSRDSAMDALTAGQLQQSQANTALSNAIDFRDSKLAIAQELDQRGLIR